MFSDQLPGPATTGQSYNLVRGVGGGGGQVTQALLEFLQGGEGPGLGSAGEEVGSIPAHWQVAGWSPSG